MIENQLQRFLLAQEKTFINALEELKAGKKTTHWMWYIFPQIKGLGRSEIARKFEIEDEKEAIDYLKHEILGRRLLQLSEILVHTSEQKTSLQIFGAVDELKLKSCMTLFKSVVDNNKKIFPREEYSIFKKVLAKYYAGVEDEATRKILKSSP